MRRSNQFLRLFKAGVFSRRGYAMQDPDAAAYVAAVKAAGVTDAHLSSLGMPPWSVIAPAIDSFFLGEKAASRWVFVERIYLPVWGILAANAIGLKSLASGTFVGGVTPTRGFVQGNGTTGYFNTGFNPTTTAMTRRDSWQGYLQYSAKVTSNQSFIGNGNNAFAIRRITSGDTIQATPGNISWGGQNGQGIISSRAGSVGNNQLFRRHAGGRAEVANSAVVSAGALPSESLFAMASNNAGTAVGHSNAQHGCWWWGEDPGDAGDSAFTANLRTLWETVTGLTLP